MKSKLIRYGIASAIGLAIAYLVLRNYGFFTAETMQERYFCLHNACTIPGILLAFSGILVWISQQGMFDFLGYAGKMMVDMFKPNAEHLRYGDYVVNKQEKRNKGGFGFLLITGSAFLVLAVLFLVLYYTAA